jgi:antitoxin ParD1/3/4
MTIATMNISLPAPMKEFIDVQLKAGGYSSTSEYVRELIRRDQVAKAEARLKEMLLEGLNSGPSMLMDETYFDSVLSRGIALARA